MTNDATEAQNQAADPRFSTWLSANAGSGKTRVLIDRVARLLLHGTEPQNILCLTYTKAAASEMQNRLFARLGEWAMLDDDSLRKALAELGEDRPLSLRRARTLFARAVETPGGLKIQTIHSFCSSILRQFPLEAGVSPQFSELDEPRQKALVEEVIDRLAISDDPALQSVALIHSGESLTDLALAVTREREEFSTPKTRNDIFRLFGVPAGRTPDDVLATALSEGDVAFLRRSAAILATSESISDRKLAARLAELPDPLSGEAFEILEGCFLTGESAKAGAFVPKAGKIPTRGLREGAFQPFCEKFDAIAIQVGATRTERVSLEAATRAAALHGFAQSLLPAYAAEKEAAGALDFDDLIYRARALLTDASLEWVLYRLDSGIEHILVDEAQDTSPEQWEVIKALTSEITAGEGVSNGRTLFVVGDKKQSIYSFQGADARVFDRMAETFDRSLKAGSGLNQRDLLFSFRSSTAILSTVDAVFEGDSGQGLGYFVQHRAFRPALPGRVDLWPITPKDDTDDPQPWFDPVDRVTASDPKIRLADGIAKAIRHMVDFETITDKNGEPRRIRPGDVLILVQRRSDLFDHVIRACKAADLPMAGADRLRIAGELAVRDLLALLSFLALQEDDLALAAALRSPLFGWSELQLYNLAQGRKQRFLWAELRDRQKEFPETFGTLNALLGEVDFLRPYELLEVILIRLDGRKRILARLGPEAEDGIDELLTQALTYERDAVPSLTGFLTHAQSEDIEIKRQSGSSEDLIRVMTVHGSKGLESPIVILPDTTRAEKPANDLILVTEEGTPVWNMSRSVSPDTLAMARNRIEEADREERRRLLYVAMTRAESWLIVCGAETHNSKNHWHRMVERGLHRLGPTEIETEFGSGLRVSHGVWPDRLTEPVQDASAEEEALPEFLLNSVDMKPAERQQRSPSDLGGAKVLGGGGREEAAALRHGRQIHLLLEFLPRLSCNHLSAGRILACGEDKVHESEVGDLFSEAMANIDAHPLLFSEQTMAEVDVAAMLPTLGHVVEGTIDRLIIAAGIVTAVDFKTNAIVPESALDVPEGILRQMGAYLEALEQIFPDCSVSLQILWTRTAELMDIPNGIVRKALSRATTS